MAYLSGAFGHSAKPDENRGAKSEATNSADTSRSKGPSARPKDDAIPEESGFAVRMGSGEWTSEPDLKIAMQRAIWSKGRVVLNNKTPLLLKGSDAAIQLSGGPLIVAAAPGTQPVLEVEVKGKNAFLSSRSDTPIQLVGITILARYAGQSQDVPALIDAGQDLVIDRCAFKASGAVKGEPGRGVRGRHVACDRLLDRGLRRRD